MEKLANEITSKDIKPYVIPLGGSNKIGNLGYVTCVQEVLNQTFDIGIKMDHIVTALGRGGTYAGLAIGLRMFNYNASLTGISISGKREEQTQLIHQHLKDTLNHLKVPPEQFDNLIDTLRIYDDYVGKGYAIPTEEMIDSVKLVAQTEGILLDPVYTGKAMAGLLNLIKRGYFKKEDSVLFIHTGGSPALYTHTDIFSTG